MAYDHLAVLSNGSLEAPIDCDQEMDLDSRPPSPLQPVRPIERPLSLRARKISCFQPRPIPNSYWATPLLLACEYPWTPHRTANSISKLDALLKAGVKTFIDLTECGELCSYATAGVLPMSYSIGDNDDDRIEYHNFPIVDRSLPRSHSYLLKILNQIQSSVQQGRATAVHCRGGIGRTGTVIGCFLVQSGIAKDGPEALKMIAELWKGVEKCRNGRYLCSPETGEQEEFVRKFRRIRI